MDDKHFRKWEKRRQLGALRFIFVFGLAWGLSVVALHYSVSYVMTVFWSDTPGSSFSADDLAMRFGSAVIGGFIWSSVMWLVFESRFRVERDRRSYSESGRYTLDI
jgi:hypothetical protein